MRGGSLVRADEQEIAREHRKQAARIWQMTHLDPRARHRARPPGRRRARRALTQPTARSRATGVTDDDGRIRELADTRPGTYRIVFHPPSPFFKRVELEIELGDGHHHVRC